MSHNFGQIFMRGDYVAFQQVEESYAKLEDLASFLGMSSTVAVGPLPYGCRFVTSKADQNLVYYIIERPPTVVPIGFQFHDIIAPEHDEGDFNYFGPGYRGCEEKKEVFQLAIPFEYYIFKFFNNTMECFFTGWSKKPLMTLDERIYWAGLPNVYSNFKVCVGSTFEANPNDAVDVQIEKAIETFFTTSFNRDLTETFLPYLDYFGGSFQGWEDASKDKDPLEVWKPHRLHHHSTIERLVGLA